MNDAVVVASISAIPATVAAVAAWKAAKNSKPVSNGFTTQLFEEIGQIKGLVQSHIEDERAHRP